MTIATVIITDMPDNQYTIEGTLDRPEAINEPPTPAIIIATYLIIRIFFDQFNDFVLVLREVNRRFPVEIRSFYRGSINCKLKTLIGNLTCINIVVCET